VSDCFDTPPPGTVRTLRGEMVSDEGEKHDAVAAEARVTDG